MADQKQTKCAQASCTCMAAQGSKYCSDRCEEMGSTTVTRCACGHAGCAAAAGSGGTRAAGGSPTGH